MNTASLEKSIIFILRIFVGWTFLYAGTWQIWEHYSAAGFLGHVVMFHDFFAVFATPVVLPFTDFLIKWGHLLIGLSLVSGLLVRVSGPFGVLLMVTYYFAHLQWPFIENHLNLLVDFRLVYATVLVYLIAHNAGHMWRLDVEHLHVIERHLTLRSLVG